MGLVASTTIPLRKPCPAERSGGAFGRRPSEHARQGATRSEDRRRRRAAGGESQRRRSRARFQPCAIPHAPRRTVHRYYDPTTGEFLTVDPDVAETGQPYYYAGDDPVNATDPSGLCKETSISCRWDNLIWEDDIDSNGGAPLGITNVEAENLLVSNNFTDEDAQSFVDSFTGGIQIALLNKIEYPLYRYWGGKNGPTGFFFGDDPNYSSPSEAKAAMNLPEGNTATFVESATYNTEFVGAPLVLFGMVAGGDPLGAVQYTLYDPKEVAVGPSMPTGSGIPPAMYGQLDIPDIDIEPDAYVTTIPSDFCSSSDFN